MKPYTNVKPAAAIDWAAMDAKIQTPGVVAAYKAAVESIKVEPIDPSPILKSLHAKYDKLVRKPCRWAVGGGLDTFRAVLVQSVVELICCVLTVGGSSWQLVVRR